MSLTQERLKELLTYSPETGLFYWKVRRGGQGAGVQAGTVNKISGYVLISIDGVQYYAHRLAWLYSIGELPKDQIDHINGERSHNRLSNLREATPLQNNKNVSRHKDNSSGFKGVYKSSNGPNWFARVFAGGKIKHLGSFPTKEDAAAAYDSAARSLHGEFAKLNEVA